MPNLEHDIFEDGAERPRAGATARDPESAAEHDDHGERGETHPHRPGGESVARPGHVDHGEQADQDQGCRRAQVQHQGQDSDKRDQGIGDATRAVRGGTEKLEHPEPEQRDEQHQAFFERRDAPDHQRWQHGRAQSGQHGNRHAERASGHLEHQDGAEGGQARVDQFREQRV